MEELVVEDNEVLDEELHYDKRGNEMFLLC